MREIKFRGQQNTPQYLDIHKRWIVGLVETKRIEGEKRIGIRSENNHTWYEVLPETVGQYTGLKDKNGKTYCQDDLVKYRDKVYRLILGNYMFELRGFYESSQDNPTDFFSETAWREGEIIGNIWENPELIN